MKRSIVIIFAIILVFFITLIAAIVFSLYNQKPQDLSKISNSQIIFLLSKNSDANSYMQSHKDFKIKDRIVLNKYSILAGQNSPNFKEVYQGLELENNRYLRVDLTNYVGDRGFIAVLDFKTNQTVKAYGIILLKRT